MEADFRVNAEDLSAAGLGSIVSCAVAIGMADGSLDDAEQAKLAQNLCAILGDSEAIPQLVSDGIAAVDETGRNDLFEQAKGMLDDAGRDACFIVATAVAASAGSIGAKEGVALQDLARALEIGYPSARYNQLLGKGMTLGRRS